MSLDTVCGECRNLLFEGLVAVVAELCEEVVHTVLIVSFATALHVKLAKEASHDAKPVAVQVATVEGGPNVTH